MRLIRFLLLILFTLPFAACHPEPAPPVSPLAGHTGNYEASAVIRLGELRAEAAIARLSPDRCDVRFSAPESLAGMEFRFRPDWVTVSYGGLEFPVDGASLPAGAAAGVMRSALAVAMRRDAVTVTEVPGGAELGGTIEAGGFRLSLTPDGIPRKLSLPGEELEIAFPDFTFLD